MAAPLPPLALILSPDSRASPTAALSAALSTLFEPSPILHTKLVPSLSASPLLPTLTTYAALIDLATSTISSWDTPSQASFIAAHPRIGEVANLSLLSQHEQAAKTTSPAVLARLAHLNAAYEERYPGLRYVTFVNGRTRTEIMEELERKLRDEADADAGADAGEPRAIGGAEWCAELARAVRDVGRIAKSRARTLGAA